MNSIPRATTMTSGTLSEREELVPARPGQVLMVLALAAMLVGGSGCSGEHPGQAVSASVARCTEASCQPRIQIGVGSVVMGLARAVVAVADVELEPEAQAALRAIRAAGVSIYQLERAAKAGYQANLLPDLDQTMNQRGFDRVVTVLDRHETVALYVSRPGRSSTDLGVCVLVLDGRELVVISGRADPQPLIELALASGAPRITSSRRPAFEL